MVATKHDIDTLKAMINDLKIYTLHGGHYSPPCTPEKYDRRIKSKAFRSMAYNTGVRRINVLEKILGRYIKEYEEARPAPKSAPKEAEEAQKHLTTAAAQNNR
jgi:hypothetical protein